MNDAEYMESATEDRRYDALQELGMAKMLRCWVRYLTPLLRPSSWQLSL